MSVNSLLSLLTMSLLSGLYASPVSGAGDTSAATPRRILSDGWALQPSPQVEATGAELSTPGFPTRGWYVTSVPSTVLSALVSGRVYPDPYFGMNLRSIPGASYPIGRNFSRLPMPPESPFRSSWWYRKEFDLPPSDVGRSVALHFDGINFRANVWLNGQLLAGTDSVVGAYRRYEFDISEIARPGEPNALAVEVFPPHKDDLALTWVDWNPMAPDKGMGLWREVYLTIGGPAVLRHPHVVSDLELPSLASARLTVAVDVRNTTDRALQANLSGKMEGVRFSKKIDLAPSEKRTVVFAPDEFPQLDLSKPRLWWPYDMGPQNLYDLELTLESGNAVSDRTRVSFGIRKITSELTDEGHRLFGINGRRLLIRGGGWTPDLLLRFSPELAESELRYVRDMNLNTIRLEGKMEPEPFFELADRYGILIMAGWCCCHHWERWDDWKEEDYGIAAESLRSQILRLRTHPSMLVWLNGSDFPPPARVEKTYLGILEELRWPNPVVSNATEAPAEHSGPSGVKMNGPYEWIPPSYWLTDTKNGGAWGFATEVGPGPVVPPLESLRQMLPESSLWPIDEQWNFHAGGGQFRNLRVFTEALGARYGEPGGVEDYAFKSQVMAYEGLRAMFEAYARNKYTSTGVIQWMLNDAWPSMIWHLYDYYLRPGGAYFGTKKGCETIHVQYSYDDGSIVVVNGQYQELEDLEVTAQIYDLDLRERYSRTLRLDVPPDASVRAFAVDPVEGLSRTYFLRLGLRDPKGDLLSSNFYWLSTQPDVLDWEAPTWYYTPTRTFADLTGLEELPTVELQASTTHEREEDERVTRVTLENPTEHLAFAVRLRLLRDESGAEVLPILWEDNYFELMPGETREIAARYRAEDLGENEPVVAVDGWNVLGRDRVTARVARTH
jgi:exo-1,4-beta-D-glucosaminidase